MPQNVLGPGVLKTRHQLHEVRPRNRTRKRFATRCASRAGKPRPARYTVCKPCWETKTREICYTVCKPVWETKPALLHGLQAVLGKPQPRSLLHGVQAGLGNQATRCYTVCKPVWETKTRCYTVCKPCWETKTREICYTVCKPVLGNPHA